MKTKRLSDNIEKILNTQIVNEGYSSAIYRAMANCLEYNGIDSPGIVTGKQIGRASCRERVLRLV